jgi:DNA-binding response OmpR family regulator
MKVLFMSGYTDDAIVQHGVLAAGMHFIQKPFTPRSLAQRVREVLDAGGSTGA